MLPEFSSSVLPLELEMYRLAPVFVPILTASLTVDSGSVSIQNIKIGIHQDMNELAQSHL